jgi:hypothetical protein
MQPCFRFLLRLSCRHYYDPFNVHINSRCCHRFIARHEACYLQDLD